MKLLIECARARPRPADIRLAAGAVTDWNATLDLAAQHKLSSLVAYCLAAYCPECVPDAPLQAFRQAFDASTKCALRYGAELARLVRRFAAADVPLVAFKGPAVAWPLYDAPGMREMSDIDLLVSPADAPRAISLLEADRYVPSCHTVDRRFFRWNREMPFFSPGRSVPLDLHWSLVPSHYSFALDLDAFLSRLVTVSVVGCNVPALAPTDLLVYLCIHGAKHEWSSLNWLADVARLIDRGDLDWDALLNHCDRRRVSLIVFLGLLLAEDLLGAPVPAAVAARARLHPRAPSLAAAICRRLRAGLPPSERSQLALVERKRDKLKFCLGHLAPTPADLEALSIPHMFFPLYYAARPARLALKHGSRAARNLRTAILSRL